MAKIEIVEGRDSDWSHATNVVLKEYLDFAPTENYYQDAQCQSLAKYYSEEYNKLKPHKKIDFLPWAQIFFLIFYS